MDTISSLNFEYYYRIYDVVHQMMEDRGFTPEKKKMTLEKHISKMVGYTSLDSPFEFMDKICIVFYREDTKILVYFYLLDCKIKKADVETIYLMMKNKDIEKLLLVLEEPVSSKVSSILKTLKCQIFFTKEISFNPLKHDLQPKFIPLDNQAKQKLLDDYKVTVDKIPGLNCNNIVAKWYDLKLNDIVKIVRKNGELYYRAVREL